MIHHQFDRDQGILIVTPEGPLEKVDFEQLAPLVDGFIAEHGKLNGLMIYVETFPGWNDFAAMLSHFTFVKDHHRHIAKVAAVTNSAFLSILPRVVDHFIQAEVKHFDYDKKQDALAWLGDQSGQLQNPSANQPVFAMTMRF